MTQPRRINAGLGVNSGFISVRMGRYGYSLFRRIIMSKPSYKRYLPVFLALLALFTMSCGLMDTVVNGVANKVGNAVIGTGDAGTVAELWPDVPKLDSLKQENIGLSTAAKLAFGVVINASSKGKGTVNFIAFTTKQTPQDVADFYTNDRMTGTGWDKSDQTGCGGFNGDTPGSVSSGDICGFSKDLGNNKQALLGIFIAIDPSTKLTQVFFMRLEATIDPTATP